MAGVPVAVDLFNCGHLPCKAGKEERKNQDQLKHAGYCDFIFAGQRNSFFRMVGQT
jgi:hypothetical protein